MITSNILKAQALKLWQYLPQYSKLKYNPPKFLNSWLTGFKARFSIKEYIYHREAGDTVVFEPNSIAQMEVV